MVPNGRRQLPNLERVGPNLYFGWLGVRHVCESNMSGCVTEWDCAYWSIDPLEDGDSGRARQKELGELGQLGAGLNTYPEASPTYTRLLERALTSRRKQLRTSSWTRRRSSGRAQDALPGRNRDRSATVCWAPRGLAPAESSPDGASNSSLAHPLFPSAHLFQLTCLTTVLYRTRVSTWKWHGRSQG